MGISKLSAVSALVNSSPWWRLGALSGAMAVGFGAFGAHGLKSSVKDANLLKTWDTAAHYHLMHSIVLMLAPLSKRPNTSGRLLTAGILLFSGSLYALVLTDKRALGAITPIGGMLMIGGWLSFVL